MLSSSVAPIFSMPCMPLKRCRRVAMVLGRQQPNAPVEAGYWHSVASIMTNAAARTGERATFDEKNQRVLAGGKEFTM